ncbi:MAG TPA: 3D domain-containing protein [Pyrinomonadaceae bacterium]
MKSIFSGSALLCSALLGSSLIISASSSAAEPRPLQTQQQTKPNGETSTTVADEKGSVGEVVAAAINQPETVAPPTSYVATAYSLRGRTASGRTVSKGLIAADPRLLPLGSRVKVEAGNYSGEYLVADTGGAVRGRHIDIWTPTSREAMRFGKRTIKLTVLSWGGKKKTQTVKK